MQNNQLKIELVHALNLERHGYSHPEAVYFALEQAQAEICHATHSSPGATFSVGSNMLQSLVINQNEMDLTNHSEHIMNSLLRYSDSEVHPDRIVHFNFGSGDKMVETYTFKNCNIDCGSISISCFAIATLYLDSHPILSVVFAPVH